jgi:RHS repeat-associated protein
MLTDPNAIMPPVESIDSALGPNALALKGKDGKPGGAIWSSVPVAVPVGPPATGGTPATRAAQDAVRRWEPADLRWKTTESGRFATRRSIGTTSVPATAGGEIRLGPLRVTLDSENSASDAVVDDDAPETVIYPSIDAAADGGAGTTDLVLRSLTNGFRFGYVVRDPAAPQTHRLSFDDLPKSFTLKRNAQTDGAVDILDENDRAVVSVTAPMAKDAEGNPVPIKTTISEQTVEYRIVPDLDDVLLPLTVDPEVTGTPGYLTYNWGGQATTDTNGWQSVIYRSGTTPFAATAQMGSGSSNGLYLSGNEAVYGAYYQGDYASWIKFPPSNQAIGSPIAGTTHKVSSEHAYWYGWDATFDYTAAMTQWWHSAGDPGVSVGLWSNGISQQQPNQKHQTNNCGGCDTGWNGYVAGGWAADRVNMRTYYGARVRGFAGSDWSSAQNSVPSIPPAADQQPGNIFDWGLVDGGAYNTFGRPATLARLSAVRLYAADNVNPTISSAAQTPGWKDPGQTLSVSGSDNGMGVRKLALQNSDGSVERSAQNQTCPATGDQLCPFTATATLALTNVPAGTSAHRFAVTDGGGRTGTQAISLLVDNSKPTAQRDTTQIDGSGAPKAVRPTGTDTALQTIKVLTADTLSGVKTVSAKVDGQATTASQPSCTGTTCPTSFVTSIPATGLSTGTHQVEVTVKDQVASTGNTTIDTAHTRVVTLQVTVVNATAGAPRAAEPGLGFEDWMTYDSTDTGAGSTQRVNLASGNSLWSVTPISNPGIGFDTVIRLTYNSLEPSGLVPGLLGDNGALGYGVAGRGVSVQLGSITRLNEPLWMVDGANVPSTTGNGDGVRTIVLTDGDGTRHTFTYDSGSPGLRFNAPAGVHLELRRYNTDPNSPRFWAATRPDGSTFFFFRDGRASESEDRHGNLLRLVYGERPDFNDLTRRLRPGCGYALECRYRVTEVVDAAGLNPTGLQGVNQTQATAQTERRWVLGYDDQADSSDSVYDTMRLTSVEDRKKIGSQRRKTTLGYDGSNRLTGVTVASNAPVAAQRRSWTLGWLASTAFLSSVTDPRGNSTRIDNGDPQGSGLPLNGVLDPLLGWIGAIQDVRQVKGVADRESVNTGGIESRERRYRYETPTGTAPNQTFTTWVRSARNVSSRFTMDGSGRLTRLVEDVDDPGRNDDSPPAGTQALQLGSVQTWNTDVNAVASSTVGVKGALAPYDTTEAVTTEYTWGALGQLRQEKEYKGPAGSTASAEDTRTRTWKYGQEPSGGPAAHNGPSSLNQAASDSGRQFVYDLAEATDRTGALTKYKYLPGNKGDLDEIDKPGGVDGLFDEKFTYDTAGRGLITAHQTRQWDDADSRKPWAKPDSSIGDTTGEAVVVTENFAEFDANGDAQYRKDPRNQEWRTRYDEVGNTTRVGDPRAGASLDTTTSQEQSLATSAEPAGDGGATARTGARSTGQSFVARFTYDALDRQVVQAIPKRTTATGEPDRFRVTASTFDKNDNALFERDEEEQVVSRDFSKTDEVAREQQPTAPTHAETTDANADGWSAGANRAPITRYAYDADDNLIRRKDPVPAADQEITTAGYRTEWTLDRLGRAVAQVREAQDASASSRKTISRAYDRRDNVVGEVDAKGNGSDSVDTAIANAAITQKRRNTYIYDAFDRKKQQIENPRNYPDPGATDVNRTTGWEYDKEDRQTEMRTPGGRVTKRRYDERGALIELEEPFGYNASTKTTTSTAKTIINRRRDGQVTEVISPRGNVSTDEDPGTGPDAFRTKLRYYDTGELYRRWIPKAKDQYGADWEVRYGVNQVGDPTTVRDARHNLVTNTFLDTGELAGTDRPGWWFYDEQQSTIRERTPADPAPSDATTSKDGLPSEPGNGDFGKVDPQTTPDVLPLAGQTNITYNGRLQPTAVKGVSDAGTVDAIQQKLYYDALGRLERRTIPKNTGSGPLDTMEIGWQYDVRGNVRATRRLRDASEGGSAVTTWRYDPFDRLTSTTEPPSCQGSGCLPPVTGQTWDRNDNVLSTTLPTQGNTPDAGVGTTTGTRTFTPDAADRIYGSDDEAGAHTELRFDSDDMLVKRYAPRAFAPVEPGDETTTDEPCVGRGCDGQDDPSGQQLPQDPERYATTYEYDGGGRITREISKVTDPDAATQADGLTKLITDTTYDREGNPTEIKTPGARSGAGTAAVPQRVTTRLYDARNLPWKETKASGTDAAATTVTEYDGQRNLRRTINPKGVTGNGSGATVAADAGGDGLTGDSAKNATVMVYNADQLATGRVLPFDGDDGTKRWRQDYDRNSRGLVTRITGVYRNDEPNASSRYSTTIERNLAGWPIKSTEQRRSGTTWVNSTTDPLKYDYDQLGNQTLWSSDGATRTIQRSFYRSGQLRVKCGRRTAGGAQEQVYSYRYDTAGGLKQVVDWMHHDAPANTPEVCQPAEQGDQPAGALGVRDTFIQRDRANRPVSIDEHWNGGKDTRLRYAEGLPNIVRSVQTDGRYTASTDSYSGGTSTLYTYDEQDRNTAVKVKDGGTLPTATASDRETTMTWWPSGERRQTLKPATSGGDRTRESRFFDARGQLVTRAVDPASTSVGETENTYTYDKNGNRLTDERSTENRYNARDQLTKWTRRRQSGAITDRNPAKTTEYLEIDGGGRQLKSKDTIQTPQAPGSSTIVETVIETDNAYQGEQLLRSARKTTASGTGLATAKSAQLDCYSYNAFGSQTKTYRKTNTTGSDPTPPADCSTGNLETRNVFDTFERLTAGKQREHSAPSGSDVGSLNGTQAFCYDPFDRRDRRVTGLTGAADPAGTDNDDDGRTRAQTACVTAAANLGSGVSAYDYSYLGLTDNLTRETRAGREQTYEYSAAGERLGRLKTIGTSREWRSFDTDAQGSVVGLESATDGTVASSDRYDTDPYGAPVAKDSTLAPEAQENPFRFQGFYRDQDTGTYDMQARTYRPETGSFLQQDRFENPQADLTLAMDPLTNSRYAFTAGNPSTRAEYDGHCTNARGQSVPGSPHQLPANVAGPEIPCRLVKGYKAGPLTTSASLGTPETLANAVSAARQNGTTVQPYPSVPAPPPPPPPAKSAFSVAWSAIKGGARGAAKGAAGAVDYLRTNAQCSVQGPMASANPVCQRHQANVDEFAAEANEALVAATAGTPAQGPVGGFEATLAGVGRVSAWAAELGRSAGGARSAGVTSSASRSGSAAGAGVVRVPDFASTAKAFEHYAKHARGVVLKPRGVAKAKSGGADVGEFRSFSHYRAEARRFLGDTPGAGVLQRTRPGGDILRVDPATGYFGVRTRDGVIRTFFRPDGDPVAYFRGQP